MDELNREISGVNWAFDISQQSIDHCLKLKFSIPYSDRLGATMVFH
ncbi:hypothetical protein EV198_0486 [Roseivirga ehrenbergii]|nr:hypothetical protein EV198_0486 [Roseivirga ehrenbergii]